MVGRDPLSPWRGRAATFRTARRSVPTIMNATSTAATPFVHEQFDDIEQQRSAAQLGMWIFLATEVLFFGGLFLAYTVYRSLYPQTFAAASHHTEVILGGINTAILLFSSTLMALAVRAAELRNRKQLVWLLLGTAFLGIVFMVSRVSNTTRILWSTSFLDRTLNGTKPIDRMRKFSSGCTSR